MAEVDEATVDAVWSSHNLEHLFAHDVLPALREFYRVLKPEGYALIAVPDVQAVAEAVAQDNLEGVLYESPAGPISAIDILWGHRASIAKGNEFMAHKTGFTARSLKAKLREAGFQAAEVHRNDLDLLALALKRES